MVIEQEEEQCECQQTEFDYHQCPYDADVNNDPDSECDCCPRCTQECADNI